MTDPHSTERTLDVVRRSEVPLGEAWVSDKEPPFPLPRVPHSTEPLTKAEQFERFAGYARIAELEAEVERLRGVVKRNVEAGMEFDMTVLALLREAQPLLERESWWDLHDRINGVLGDI